MHRWHYLFLIALLFPLSIAFGCAETATETHNSTPSTLSTQEATPNNMEPATTPPADPAFATCDRLLQRIIDSLGIRNLPSALGWYNFTAANRDSIRLQAAQAFTCYQNLLPNFPENGQDYILCLEKLALTTHFQCPNFVYSDSLPTQYHAAISYIERAIEAQKMQPMSLRLPQLYETAAQIAKPHFYWGGYQTQVSVDADQKAYGYLREAAAAYGKMDEKRRAVATLRQVGDPSLAFQVELVEAGLTAEGDTSLQVAMDIVELFHRAVYREVPEEDRPKFEDWAPRALKALETHTLDAHQQVWHRAFHREIGYYHLRQKNAPDVALPYYLKTQEMEMAAKEDLHYTAFYIAAIYIEKDELDKAMAQYDLALTDARLSPTDTEHAWFGKAMVEMFRGNEEAALKIWKENIGDTRIMNGVSGYPSRFSAGAKGRLKELAGKLAKAAGAENAGRIIQENWP